MTTFEFIFWYANLGGILVAWVLIIWLFDSEVIPLIRQQLKDRKTQQYFFVCRKCGHKWVTSTYFVRKCANCNNIFKFECIGKSIDYRNNCYPDNKTGV
jgi:hypothetical protein